MSRKKLLRESTVSRFMTLAGNSKHTKRFINENVDVVVEDDLAVDDMEAGLGDDLGELGEQEGGDDLDFLTDDLLYEEGEDEMSPPVGAPPVGDPGLEDEVPPPVDDMASDPDSAEVEPIGDESGAPETTLDQAAVEKIAAAIPALQQIADAAGVAAGEGAGEDVDLDADLDVGAEDLPPDDADLGGPPEGAEALPPGGGVPPEEPPIEEEILEALLNKTKLSRLTNEVYKRVARRIIREKLSKR